MSESSQSSLAVLIDYENLALGTGKRKKNGHQEPGPRPDVKRILERLVDKGRITAKRAYCDWQRFEDAITPLHELGIELIEIPDRAYTGKNSADIRLSVDAMEMCLTKDHIDTFAILSGDSDFSPLVTKLKEFGKTVIGVGMKQSTSPLLAEVCDEFLFYEHRAHERRAGLRLARWRRKSTPATSCCSRPSTRCRRKATAPSWRRASRTP